MVYVGKFGPTACVLCGWFPATRSVAGQAQSAVHSFEEFSGSPRGLVSSVAPCWLPGAKVLSSSLVSGLRPVFRRGVRTGGPGGRDPPSAASCFVFRGQAATGGCRLGADTPPALFRCLSLRRIRLGSFCPRAKGRVNSPAEYLLPGKNRKGHAPFLQVVGRCPASGPARLPQALPSLRSVTQSLGSAWARVAPGCSLYHFAAVGGILAPVACLAGAAISSLGG